MAVLEALSGFADFDDNGEVTLREAFEYVPKRYREWFTPDVPDDQELMPVLARGEATPFDRPLCKPDPSLAAVAFDGHWFGATILERKEGSAKVRFLGWDPIGKEGPYSFPDTVVPDEMIDLPGGRPPALVRRNDAWLPARVLDRGESETKIHYLGSPDSENETVANNRIRIPFVHRARPGFRPFQQKK
jgi:hypothetical protein